MLAVYKESRKPTAYALAMPSQNSACPGARGNAITSRMFCIAVMNRRESRCKWSLCQ